MWDAQFMRFALRLARRGYGETSPNPMVGAVLVKSGKIIGRGWHRRAGLPHAEIEALRDAEKRGQTPRGATLYVTLEPCSTHGRTPPCSTAIIAAGIKRVVGGAIDPNPKHAGKGLKVLKRAGVEVVDLSDSQIGRECAALNEAFNHWIVHRTPFVTVKAGMTLDGKIATASGESKWITGDASREFAMHLRRGADAILVGVNTILADNPSLTVRLNAKPRNIQHSTSNLQPPKQLRRIILDSMARTPPASKVASDELAALTTIVVGPRAPKKRIAVLAKRTDILVTPTPRGTRTDSERPDLSTLPWLMKELGAQNITNLLVEGGGEVNGSFLAQGLAQRIAFFYAPKILGGRDSRKSVAGEGARSLAEIIELQEPEWRQIAGDLFLTARVKPR